MSYKMTTALRNIGRLDQGRSLNVNHEAACFIGKTGGVWLESIT